MSNTTTLGYNSITCWRTIYDKGTFHLPRQESECEPLGDLWRLKCVKSRQKRKRGTTITTTEKLKIDSVKSLEDSFQVLLFFLGRISIIKCFIERKIIPK